MKQAARFDGKTYNHKRDHIRLSGLLGEVYGKMRDGKWRSIRGLADEIGAGSEASVSARLRDLRKPKFGGHTIEREYLYSGVYIYRLVISK